MVTTGGSEYYGRYRSAVIGQTGCVAELVTVAQPDLSFPPSLLLKCPLCSQNHQFRFAYAHTVSTPRQKKQFDEYCKTHRIFTDYHTK